MLDTIGNFEDAVAEAIEKFNPRQVLGILEIATGVVREHIVELEADELPPDTIRSPEPTVPHTPVPDWM